MLWAKSNFHLPQPSWIYGESFSIQSEAFCRLKFNEKLINKAEHREKCSHNLLLLLLFDDAEKQRSKKRRFFKPKWWTMDAGGVIVYMDNTHKK